MSSDPPTTQPSTDPPTVGADTVDGLLAAANQRLTTGTPPRYGTDQDLIEYGFPDWETVAVAERLPMFGGPRIVMRHRSTPTTLMLVHPNSGNIRLLLKREYESDTFRFDTNDHTGCTFLVGTEDTIFDYVVAKHRRMHGKWNTDVLLWFIDVLPGPRADAERFMLGLWFSQMQQPRNNPR